MLTERLLQWWPCACRIAHVQTAQLLASQDLPRLRGKVEGLIKEFGAVQDRLQNNYTKGLVDGFDRPLVPQ